MACSWPRTCAGCKKLDGIESAKEHTCFSCRFFGPETDMCPICHKTMTYMRPCETCGAWEGKNHDQLP